MSENAITISNLNDFIFCPASIYFHNLDADAEKLAIQDSAQLNGSAAHRSIDKERIFLYIQDYYRCFMKELPPEKYPVFALEDS